MVSLQLKSQFLQFQLNHLLLAVLMTFSILFDMSKWSSMRSDVIRVNRQDGSKDSKSETMKCDEWTNPLII